jgi:CheY-like chemotaxis protein
MPKVLVVDDNPDERQIYSALLRYKGFDVLEAADGFEAIKVAKAERPDVVLVDYMMPQITGLGVAVTLRNTPETKSIPIICMTAYDLSVKTALAAGCQALWEKPIPVGKLVLGLDQAIRPVRPDPMP